MLEGNIGRAILKTSSLREDQMKICAPARVFHSQEAVTEACRTGELDRDVVCVICYQGPKANGMPELHNLLPQLTNIEAKGFKVAIVSDGRMSGASGKLPSAIHVSPEAQDGGWIGRIQDGDIIYIDGHLGKLQVEPSEGSPTLENRQSQAPTPTDNTFGCGRELFAGFRHRVGRAEHGASVLF